MKPEWCNRVIGVSVYYTLCLSEKDFWAELERLECDERPQYKHARAGTSAATHHLETGDGKRVSIVTMYSTADDPIVIAGLLVHEAVHIWQASCRDIGETEPGGETEAYAVQRISQELMWEYARQTKRARKK